MWATLTIRRPGGGIAIAEWDELRERDETLTPTTVAGKSCARWIRDGRPNGYFCFRDGYIFIEYPDDPQIEKAREIAKTLSAQVFGDDDAPSHSNGVDH